MILSGIADEAGEDIQTQVKAHKELGWDHIELRLVNGKNSAAELPDKEFDSVCKVLEKSKMQATCFASQIGNWSRHIKDDFNIDVNDLKKAIKRMRRLNFKYIRVMSWKGEGVDNKKWRDESIRRLKELTKMASDSGIYLCHENCTGWGGLSANHMLEVREAVNNPYFVLMYDLGNTVSYGLDPELFFRTIRKNFEYIHIKDAKKNPEGGPSNDFKYCGEGDAMVPEILSKVISEDKYDGVISIEPHVASIVHRSEGQNAPSPQVKYDSYIKYGRMLMDILEKIKG